MYSVTRTTITKVTPFIKNGYTCEYTYETVEITTSKTAKKGWEIATKDCKDGGYVTTQSSNDPIGHVCYEWDVRKI